MSKKGFVASPNDPTATDKINSLNVKWYYTWGMTSCVPSPNNIKFTPMFWSWNTYNTTKSQLLSGSGAMNALQTLTNNSDPNTENVLLGYNEPDGINAGAQANMNISDAVNYWPYLSATGRRLGSPVMFGSLVHSSPSNQKNNIPQPPNVTGPTIINISNTSTPNNVTLDPLIWLDNFLIQLSQLIQSGHLDKNNNIIRFPDFITVHWYGPPNASSFLNYISNIHTKYNLPIWITEFAVANWNATFNGTGAEAPYDYPTDNNISTNATSIFIEQVTAGLEAMPFVERYSWKTRPLLIPSTDPLYSCPPTDATPMNIDNPDVMGSSAIFNTYKKHPIISPPALTPFGKLYKSI